MATPEEDQSVDTTATTTAAGGKKKTGKKKGKTVPLTQFLVAGGDEKEPKKIVKVAKSWAETVDEENAQTQVFDVSNLPTAPRRTEIDYDAIPKFPPFTAHVANLSFEITDEQLRLIFGDLPVKSARISKEGNRSRGMGFVEFETREALIEGLKKNEKEWFGRKIRVSVSDKTHHDSDRAGGGYGDRQKGASRSGESDRADASDNWRRGAEPRTDEQRPDDRRGPSGFDRMANPRDRDFPGRAEGKWGGDRDRDRDGQRTGGDFGYGYASRNAREGGDRGYDRPPQRNRYDDDARRDGGGGSSSMDRPRYSGRYSDTRDTRDRRPSNEDRNEQSTSSSSTTRPRLQLQPRSKPLDEAGPLSGSSSSINNVAATLTTPASTLHSSPHSSTAGGDDRDTESVTSVPTSRHAEQDEQEDGRSRHEDDETTNAAPRAPPPSKGAGASIFGGAKPVDTATKELEIEKKLKEMNIASEPRADESSSSRPPYRSGGGEREPYRSTRSSHADDYRDRRDDYRTDRDRDRDRRDEGGRRGEFEENRRRGDDDYDSRRSGGYENRDRDRGTGSDRDRGTGSDRDRGTGSDRDRYGGASGRRGDDSGPPRSSKYNYHDNSERDSDRGGYRDSYNNGREQYGRHNRDNDERDLGPPSRQRGYDSNSRIDDDDHYRNPPQSTSRVPPPSSSASTSNDYPRNSYNSSSNSKEEPSITSKSQRTAQRRVLATDDNSNRLALSNKFGMLDDEAETPTDDE